MSLVISDQYKSETEENITYYSQLK